MSSSSDMNIVLGQGSVVKEIHSIRRQQLELNQGFVQQQATELNSKKRKSVELLDNQNKIENEKEKQKKRRRHAKEKDGASPDGKTQDESDSIEGSLIDIRV